MPATVGHGYFAYRGDGGGDKVNGQRQGCPTLCVVVLVNGPVCHHSRHVCFEHRGHMRCRVQQAGDHVCRNALAHLVMRFDFAVFNQVPGRGWLLLCDWSLAGCDQVFHVLKRYPPTSATTGGTGDVQLVLHYPLANCRAEASWWCWRYLRLLWFGRWQGCGV